MSAIVGGNLFEDHDHVEEAIETIGYRGTSPIQVAESREGFFLARKDLDIQTPPGTPSGCCVAFDGLRWDCGNRFYQDFKNHGDLFIKDLDGMFSFCMMSQDRSQVYFGRDWAGMVPLYYILREGKIAFASEMKVLVQHLDAVRHEIHPFPPGHYSLYDRDTGVLEHYQYYSLPVYPEVTDPPEVMSQTIRRLLEDSIAQQARWNAPVCVLLSGGIDSVVVAHLLKKHVSDLTALVVSMGEAPRGTDDIAFARSAAEFLEIPLHEVVVDEPTILSMIEEGILVAEDPKLSMVSTAIPMTLLGTYAGSLGYKIAFTGEGSDGLWGSFGHIQAWFKESERFKTERHKLVTNGYKTNIARTNKALQYGGCVQAMFPFLYKPLAEYAMGIPPEYMNETLPVYRRVMKPLFRHAFKGDIPDDLLYRKKKTLQQGSHIEGVVKKFGEDKLRTLYDKHFPPNDSVESLFAK